MGRRALIFGANGQDGSYLAELLLDKGYEVFGTVRRSSLPNNERIRSIEDKLHLRYADLSDSSSVIEAVAELGEGEVYNLAAMSDVAVSFKTPEYCGNVTGLGVMRILEAIRIVNKQIRFYQAGSSEMHGMNPDVPCNEESAFYPGSPYAAAKVYAFHVTKNYRESYGMWACNGILYNHESPRRGVEFVTRKITRAVADIKVGRANHVSLGNLDSKRDWGHSKDYVRAMWLMLNPPKGTEADDYVIATGETYSVQEFADLAFQYAGLSAASYVRIKDSLKRPVDPPVLLGDASKARRQLAWAPEYTFEDLVREMVEADRRTI